MEQELRNNEQKFRKIFDGSIDGLILWDGEQQIIDVNEPACEILEQTKEDICSQTMEMFLSSSNFDLVIEHKATIESKGEGEGDIQYKTASGKVKQIEFSTKKVFYQAYT